MVATIQIFVDRHFMITNSAKNCPRVELIFLPYFAFMGCLFMAFITGIIFIAAFEFYGNDVKW
jgi:hypothetical protein